MQAAQNQAPQNVQGTTASAANEEHPCKDLPRVAGKIALVFILVFTYCMVMEGIEKYSTSIPPEFRLDSISVSITSNFSSMSWDASFYVRNPNIKSMYYFGCMQASVGYKNVTVAAGFPSFRLIRKEDKSINIVMATATTDNNHLIESLASDYRINNGTAEFSVVIKGTITIAWIFVAATSSSPLEIYCEDLKVGFHPIIPPSGNVSIHGILLEEPRLCGFAPLKFHFWT